MRYAMFERFEFGLRLSDAATGSHQGQCDDDVEFLTSVPYIAQQLDAIDPEKIADELRDYGAWDDEELADIYQNRNRLVWIACGNIREEAQQRHPRLMGLR